MMVGTGKAKRGVYAAAITPIGPDGEPDLARFTGYCAELLRQGCDGVAPLGTTGEATSLPYSFRIRVPAALAEAGLKPDEVILGAGSPSVGDAVAIAREALAHGYSNLLVLPPYYVKDPSEEGLYAYYSRVIEAAGDDRIRVYLYHIPQVTAVPIPLALVDRLKAAFGPAIAGIKDSSGSFDSAKTYMGRNDFDVFPSSESTLVETLRLGGGGVISASTNVSAALARRVMEAIGAEQDALQADLAAVRAAVSKYPLVAAVKQVQAWRTGDESWLRILPPLVALTPAQAASFRDEMVRLGQLSGDAARRAA